MKCWCGEVVAGYSPDGLCERHHWWRHVAFSGEAVELERKSALGVPQVAVYVKPAARAGASRL